jgi:hypothetical protein
MLDCVERHIQGHHFNEAGGIESFLGVLFKDNLTSYPIHQHGRFRFDSEIWLGLAPPIRDGMEPQARHKKDPDHNKPLLSHSLFLSPEVMPIFGAHH